MAVFGVVDVPSEGVVFFVGVPASFAVESTRAVWAAAKDAERVAPSVLAVSASTSAAAFVVCSNASLVRIKCGLPKATKHTNDGTANLSVLPGCLAKGGRVDVGFHFSLKDPGFQCQEQTVVVMGSADNHSGSWSQV